MIEFIEMGKPNNKRKIAYCVQKAKRRAEDSQAGLFWLGGFKSSMMGRKASSLSGFAHEKKLDYTRMDYSGHGHSTGNFEEGTISLWLLEAQKIFSSITKGAQIIVGSSMGAWLALLLAENLIYQDKKRLKAVILIAPAWDMTENLMKPRFDAAALESLERDGFYLRSSAYADEEYVITKKLLKDGKKHLIKNRLLTIQSPIHILHGDEDPDVPWQYGQKLMNHLPHADVCFTLVEKGDHRLSKPEDLELLTKIIETFL